MRRHVDHYLVRARAAGAGRVLGVRTPVAPVVEDLRRTLLRIHRDKDLEIAARIPADAVFRGERQDLEEILGNLLDNACKWARRHIRSEEHTSELQSLMRNSYAGLCLKKKKTKDKT